MNNELTTLIKYLEEELKRLKEYDQPMDSASWGYQEGILLTGNDAIELLKILKK